jgi:hypothetical protein
MSGPAQSGNGGGQNAYFVDSLLRPTAPNAAQDNASVRAEVGVILANGLREGGMPQADKAYLIQIVAARTGLTESAAEQRVNDTYMQATEAADSARKAIAHSMYWIFLALLVGAFFASLAATIGGKRRDHAVVV